jgi:2-polyprenyl-6-hydroxyphenyl methylase/3-demethylubiquinone-9 3-methyltransferase
VPALSVNVDPEEIARFDACSRHWWDRHGALRALHDINAARLGYVDNRIGLEGRRVLDVGCGGGILAEAMAVRGAEVTGIDMGEEALAVARGHAAGSGAPVRYRLGTAEGLARTEPGRWDAVTCMELLEHVPAPESVVAACARLLRPGGHLFFATLNRTPLAGALALLAAEYVLKLVPRGTHTYRRFVKPSELRAWAEAAGLREENLSGLQYNPLLRRARVGGPTWINYLAHFVRK